MNKLYYGDCLTVMEDLPRGTVDLIYLDPPFNSKRNYNAIYKDETGRELPEQIDAFCDMWELNEETERLIRSMPILLREAGVGDEIAEFWRVWVNALRGTNPSLLAYLSYMVPRILLMRSLLKPDGSLYYHCDPTSGHYIKVMLDGIFGHSNFQNEIIWQRTSAHSDAERFGSIHDTIFFYSRGDRKVFEPQPYSKEYLKRFRRKDKDGRRWTDGDITAKGLSGGGYRYEYKGKADLWRVPLETMERLDRENRLHFTSKGGIRRKNYLDELPGRFAQSIWTDIPPVNSGADERMGYETQKPTALMQRIIKASSRPGDLVLDPFCGCGTTMEAAHQEDRQWIGIDIAIHAVKRVSKMRLQDRLGLKEGVQFTIEGVPMNIEGARDLWERDKYHFQKWAVEQADGFVTAKRTADGGIDGRLYYAIARDAPLESMVLEVKGGKVTIADVRALRGVLEREEALMAGLIIMDDLGPTKDRNFRREMASAGHIELWGNEYPKMQMLTVTELLEGQRFETPTVVGKHSLEPRMPGLPA